MFVCVCVYMHHVTVVWFSFREVVVLKAQKEKNNSSCGGHPQEENVKGSSSGITLISGTLYHIWADAGQSLSSLFVGSAQKQTMSRVI